MATDPQTHMEALNALAGDARTQVSRCAAANMPDYAKLWRGRLDALEAGVQALRERKNEITYQTQVLTEHGLLEDFGPLIGGALLSYLAEAVAASREPSPPKETT